MVSQINQESLTTPETESVERHYVPALIALSILLIILHPLFHYLFERAPNIPPDSLPLRLISVGVSAAVLGIVLIPSARRYADWLQMLNVGTAMIVVHHLVINSGNHPIYLATSLTAVFTAQLAFMRLRDWLLTSGFVFAWYVTASLILGAFTASYGLITLAFYSANYIIATAFIVIRARLQQRELISRRALQQKNVELGQMNEQLSVITERLQSELVLAREIQQSLLPPTSPAWPYLDVVCYSQPAREVGGDFYSYQSFGDGRVALAVGDVSGKGVSAALLMATSISLFNASMVHQAQPSMLLAQLDSDLVPYTKPRNQNCALCYIEFDGSTMRMANAGGVPPYVRRSTGAVEWPEVWGFALGQGLGAEIGYQSMTVQVALGDLVVLVSDGVVEAKNSNGTMFSFDRLEQTIAKGPASSSQAMVDHVVGELTRFVGHTEPHDDVTIAALRICNGPVSIN